MQKVDLQQIQKPGEAAQAIVVGWASSFPILAPASFVGRDLHRQSSISLTVIDRKQEMRAGRGAVSEIFYESTRR